MNSERIGELAVRVHLLREGLDLDRECLRDPNTSAEAKSRITKRLCDEERLLLGAEYRLRLTIEEELKGREEKCEEEECIYY